MNQFEVKLCGNSMSPSLLHGDSLVIEKYSDTRPEVGDVIFYIDGNSKEPTAHRLIHSSGRSKGDRSLVFDTMDLTKENSIGRVIGIKRANHMINWGRSGQPFKKFISFFSRQNNARTKFRYFFLFFLFFLSHLSLIFCRKSSISHNTETP